MSFWTLGGLRDENKEAGRRAADAGTEQRGDDLRAQRSGATGARGPRARPPPLPAHPRPRPAI